MIRQYNNRTVQVENGVTKYLADIFCNSTDTKPTANLVNGSKLTEVDTGKTFLYDEADTEWVEYSAGGGGGGSVCVTFTDITPTSPTSFTAMASMTSTEIETAMLEGKFVYALLDVRAMSMGVVALASRGVLEGVADFAQQEYTLSGSTYQLDRLTIVQIQANGHATADFYAYS